MCNNSETKEGVTCIFDEVHKYKNWALELKNLYDNFPDLFIVFTGSSIIDILKQNVDLSRRALIYYLQGFSFREYLAFTKTVIIKAVSINDIISNHATIASEIIEKINLLKYFDDYL